MKAMILAAGLGTRLRPLTDSRPKALVELSGRTLLEITLTRLRSVGVTDVIINVHHFADMLIDYLRSHNNFGLHIEISREDVLLDTGGGLKKAAWFFLDDPAHLDEPFLLHNVDVISNIDLSQMLQFHEDHHALATLAVQTRDSSRQLLFNNDLQLCGRLLGPNQPPEIIHRPSNPLPSDTTSLPSDEVGGTAIPGCAPKPSEQGRVPQPTSTQDGHPERSEGSASSSDSPLVTRHSPLFQSVSALHPYAFSGIHILSPRLLPLLTEDGVFSIIPPYLRLSSQGHNILAFLADHYYWRDLGRPSDLAQAALDLQKKIVL